MWQQKLFRSIGILGLLWCLVWGGGQYFWWFAPEEEIVAVVQSVPEVVVAQEYYIGMSSSQDARDLELLIRERSFGGITLNEDATRVYTTVWYPLIRIRTKKDIPTIEKIFLSYAVSYVEAVPLAHRFAEVALPPVQLQKMGIADCPTGAEKVIAYIDTRFATDDLTDNLDMYYIGKPGTPGEAANTAIIRGVRDVFTSEKTFMAIDVSADDSLLTYAFEWLLLAKHQGAEMFYMPRSMKDAYAYTYASFFDAHPWLVFVAGVPDEEVSEDVPYPAAYPRVIGVGGPDRVDADLCAPGLPYVHADTLVAGILHAGVALADLLVPGEKGECIQLDYSACAAD